ncbi:squalene synthase HpnC [Betaproteobacteria bacterium]|nr:squalene synthase HpnC [Betaproteobacteria bacterium]GHT98762.1 squalene synthase HpnC [Betaproteobacteria bacterium]GHU18551.1 squalene synthase HpnC [Betaproteobacteria bacterium]
MPVDHYENFPVASLLLPARLRPAVEAIYAFARSADDIADEGDATPAERLARLDAYRAALDAISGGELPTAPPLIPLFRKLAAAIAHHHLPLAPFYDLLDAFSQDVVKTRYADFAELSHYCARSANPVGRLMLELFGAATHVNLLRSDAICTSLQLINFCQDIAIDWRKNRVYLPQNDLAHFAVTLDDIAAGRTSPQWRKLLAFQVERARALMLEGAPLALALRGRIGWEMRLIVEGGLRILTRIEAAEFDVFAHRPRLGKADWLAVGWRALNFRYS